MFTSKQDFKILTVNCLFHFQILYFSNTTSDLNQIWPIPRLKKPSLANSSVPSVSVVFVTLKTWTVLTHSAFACLDQLVEEEPDNSRSKEQKLERLKKTGKPNQMSDHYRGMKREVIICPVCKATTRVPMGGVANLRSNHVLRNLIETMSPRKSGAGFEDEFDNEVLFGPVDVCSTHSQEVLTNYCKRCKTSLCQKCMAEHPSHEQDMIGISDQAERSREHLKAVIRKTLRRMSRLKIAKEEAAQNEAMYLEAVSSVIQKVHYTASVTVAAINRQRTEIVDEIEQSKTAVCKSFDARRGIYGVFR